MAVFCIKHWILSGKYQPIYKGLGKQRSQKLKYYSSVAPVLDKWIYTDSPYNCSSPHGIKQLCEFYSRKGLLSHLLCTSLC